MKFVYSSRSLILFSIIGALAGCAKNPKKPPLDYVPHMNDSYAVKAQHLGPFGEGMRLPPEGTVAQGQLPAYAYPTDPEGAGKNLKNPIPRTKVSLLKGQKYFNTYCIVCHGMRAEGNGSVVPKFPRPPSLHSDKVRNWTDGRIYHVITMGQNLMPSYATQLTPDERWAVINYVRVLQRAQNPSEQDLKAYEESKKAGNE